MVECPYCNNQINISILRDGGVCPSCNEDILEGIFYEIENAQHITEASHTTQNEMSQDIENIFEEHNITNIPPKDVAEPQENNNIPLLNEHSNSEAEEKKGIEVPDISPQEEYSTKNVDEHPISDQHMEKIESIVDGFQDEEATEVSQQSSHLSVENIQQIGWNDESNNSTYLEKDIPTSPPTRDTYSSNSKPKTSSNIRDMLLQSSEVDKDVLDSLKNHPFIDEEYMPEQDDLFDGSDISIIENFAFEEPSEVQDIRKLYGIDSPPSFPSELTKEIGILQEHPKQQSSLQINIQKEEQMHLDAHLINQSDINLDSSEVYSTEMEQDDLLLDDFMVQEDSISSTNEEISESLKNPEQPTSISQENISQETISNEQEEIPKWVEDDWGEHFLDEELTEVTELDSSLAKQLSKEQTTSGNQKQPDANPNNIKQSASATQQTNTSFGNSKNKANSNSLSYSTIMLYVICIILIIVIVFLGLHLIGTI